MNQNNESLTPEEVNHKLAVLQARTLAALRNVSTAVYMIQTTHNLGMTHAQRNGVEMVIEHLLKDVQVSLKTVVDNAFDDKPIDDTIPF